MFCIGNKVWNFALMVKKKLMKREEIKKGRSALLKEVTDCIKRSAEEVVCQILEISSKEKDKNRKSFENKILVSDLLNNRGTEKDSICLERKIIERNERIYERLESLYSMLNEGKTITYEFTHAPGLWETERIWLPKRKMFGLVSVTKELFEQTGGRFISKVNDWVDYDHCKRERWLFYGCRVLSAMTWLCYWNKKIEVEEDEEVKAHLVILRDMQISRELKEIGPERDWNWIAHMLMDAVAESGLSFSDAEEKTPPSKPGKGQGSVDVEDGKTLEGLFGVNGAKVVRRLEQMGWIEVKEEDGGIGLRWLKEGRVVTRGKNAGKKSTETKAWAFFCYEMVCWNHETRWNGPELSWAELTRRFGVTDEDKLRNLLEKHTIMLKGEELKMWTGGVKGDLQKIKDIFREVNNCEVDGGGGR
jgi:hypothetical protein